MIDAPREDAGVLDRRAAAFRAIVGDGGVRVVEAPHPAYAPHPTPLVHVLPRSAEALAECVRLAFRDRIPLVPVGGNTHPRVPPPGAPPACLLSTEFLDRVVEHAVEDLTLTVEAGLALAGAQARLAPHRQQLPFTAPRAERSTLGGIVARAGTGPWRKPYGLVRDQVLGIEVVHGDGRRTKAGGRVVKNVTGYDLMRLYCGSRGVLGVITRLTFRLRAVERAGCTLAFRHPTLASAWAAGFALRREFPDLFAIHAVRPPADEPWCAAGGAALVVSIRGEEDLVEALGAACCAGDRGGAAPEILARDAVPLLVEGAPGDFARAEIQVLPADGGRLLEIVEPLGPASVVLDVETGALTLGFRGGWPLDEAAERALAGRLAPLVAGFDLPSDPAFHLRRFDRFPATRPDGLALMAGLRKAFDPAGILNPGRTEIP